MLDFNEGNKGEMSFSMSVSVTRKIDIYWKGLELELKLNHQSKQIVFIDPIVLSFFSELVSLESNLPNLVIIPTNIGEKEKDANTLIPILSVLEQEGVGRRDDKVYVV